MLRAFGQEAHVLIGTEQTRGAFCVIRFFVSQGSDVPPYTHANEDETLIIESGQLEINCGGADPWKSGRCCLSPEKDSSLTPRPWQR